MKSILLVSLIVLSSIYQLDALSCYKCNPVSDPNVEACTNPTVLQPTSSACTSSSAVCISTFIYYENEIDKSKIGIYRDCFNVDSTITDPCDYYKEKSTGTNITVYDCAFCREDNCNNGTVKTIDRSEDGNGSSTIENFILYFPLLMALIFLTR